MPAAQKAKWTAEKVWRVLKEVYGLEDWQNEGFPGEVYVPPSLVDPEIIYDETTNTLTIKYPDYTDEIPNPDAAKFYPELEYEIKSLEDVDKLKEYLDDKTVEKIKKKCGNDLECIISEAYDVIKEALAREMDRELEEIENSEVEEEEICGVKVNKYEDYIEIENDDWGGEYTAYFRADAVSIDLDQVPDEDTLKCVLENI